MESAVPGAARALEEVIPRGAVRRHVFSCRECSAPTPHGGCFSQNISFALCVRGPSGGVVVSVWTGRGQINRLLG